MRVVIVGGGISAVYCANRLLSFDDTIDITILSKEKYYPYDRIHLCSLVNGTLDLDDIALELDTRVHLKLSQEVKDIYTKTKVLITQDSSYEYDKLIIATGSKPKTLFNTSAIENAATFRSAEDAYKIRDGIKGKNVVLVGVGPIGLELLDTLSKLDSAKSIHILSRGDHLYSKDLAMLSIKLMNDIFEADERVKVSFRDEVKSTKIEGNKIISLKTNKREIDDPFLIFGVGISPNIDFAKGSVAVDKGVLVDENMQSSQSDIYAVGEAAQIKSDNFIAGRVKECTTQCDVLVSNLLGRDEKYTHGVTIDSLKVGSFLLADVTSNSYNIDDIDNERIVISSKKDNRVDQYIINDNKLVKFIGINTNIDILHLQNLMKKSADIDASYFYNNRLLSERGRLVCSCVPTFELDLVDIIKENCIEDFGALKDFSQAGRVCGRCKQDIAKIIETTPKDPELAKQIQAQKLQQKQAQELALVQKRIDKFNKLHPTNKITPSNLQAAIESYDMTKEYNRWISMITANLRLHPGYESKVSQSIPNLNKIPIIWLELSDCTGNSESFIKSAHPTVEELILDFISLDYHKLLMAPSGDGCENSLESILKNEKGKYILLVEGAVPLGLDGKYLRIGPKGETGLDLLKRCAKDASLVIAVGSCAYDGGVVAAGINPTDAVGVAEALGRDDIINLPGCPTNPVNIVGTLLYYLMFDELPKLDDKNRPLWAYGYRVHDNCERRGHYDLEEFVLEWGDEGAKKGWCLFKMGCKGPYADLNCPIARFNEGTNWPVGVGHGCFGCGEGKVAFDKYANQRELPK